MPVALLLRRTGTRLEAKQAFAAAAAAAHEAGRKVALSLSDGFCVDRHCDDFLRLVDEGVDILFANEDEITRLYGVDSFEYICQSFENVFTLAVRPESPLRAVGAFYVETVRNTPLAVLFVLFFFGFPKIGVRYSTFASAIIVLSAYTGAFIAETKK